MQVRFLPGVLPTATHCVDHWVAVLSFLNDQIAPMDASSPFYDEFSQLYESIASTMSIQKESIRIASEDFHLISVKDVDELLDKMILLGEEHADMKEERIPYWAELWPSAIALGEYIMAADWMQADMRALEIGCGLGLPSIVAGKRVNQVWQTDYLDKALQFAKINWGLNYNSFCKNDLLDWGKPNPNMASEIVLASDVAYEERNFEPLLHAFSVLVKPGGKLLLTEPNRPIAKPFLARLNELGFEIQQSKLHVNYTSISAWIHIFELTRKLDL